MDAAAIRDLFADILPVRVRMMFGGYGIYDGELMFALAADGEIYLKADEVTKSRFEDVGSRPFTYDRKGKPFSLNYWLVPETALDDVEELRRWTALALQAARERKAAKPVRRRGSSPRAPLR
ncbi:TfoX/Sxy family protein [Bosea sp. BK604]|uniref:TfoX/Sxy family protein n=1 Tax=Bosea sp. BK604 TaxID=2512180 RepID=UPI00104ACDC4|nr:TfoX/Sxy family protein [Bosea sp. BK604]TCR66508.1 DNA transformation protein [Bosea sp. BK604]